MTPNDKLPEEILKQIDNESNQRLTCQKELAESECDLAYAQGEAEGYATGATTWAAWKVKHDDAKRDFERVQKSAIHYANRKDEVEKQRDQYRDQAQRMADALGAISDHIKECQNKKIHVNAMAIALTIAQALQQFKDGKGKDSPCPHCGKELSRDRNLCCRECGKEVENA